MEDRYLQKGAKWKDGLIGFFGTVIINPTLVGISIALSAVISAISYSSVETNNTTQKFIDSTISILSALLWLAIITANILAVAYFFKKQRRFVAIGIIIADALAVIIPLLIFGACIGILAFSAGLNQY